MYKKSVLLMSIFSEKKEKMNKDIWGYELQMSYVLGMVRI